jgi:hypothetical protein
MCIQVQAKAKKNYYSTPFGADRIECPNCSHYLEQIGEQSDWDSTTEVEIGDTLKSPQHSYLIALNDDLDMCLNCKYMFQDSHILQANGCTDSLYFYIYPIEFTASMNVNDISTIEQLKGFIQSLNIKKMGCSCNGNIGGDSASYPLKTHPQYYSTTCRIEWTK